MLLVTNSNVYYFCHRLDSSYFIALALLEIIDMNLIQMLYFHYFPDSIRKKNKQKIRKFQIIIK